MTDDPEDDKAVARLTSGSRGAVAAATLLGVAMASGLDLDKAIGRKPESPQIDDDERDARVERIKAAAQTRREQRNARRLAHAQATSGDRGITTSR